MIETHQRFAAAALEKITVIIPTLNEAAHIPAALDLFFRGPDVPEVIVVDGGSTDQTVDKARACGAQVLMASGGRAEQMNAGARVATGSLFLFLHADTLLPAGFQCAVRETLWLAGVAGGAFQFRLDRSTAGLRLVEKMTNWRARRLQLPYGDQALFMRAAMFREIGGFPAMPIMEDFEFVRRLRRRGRICIVPEPAITSARRWQMRGVFKTALLNQIIIAAYYLGIPPSLLARWYRGRQIAAGR